MTLSPYKRPEPQEPLEALLQQLRAAGPRKFANWKSETFESYVQGPLDRLSKLLTMTQKDDPDPDSPANFARLIYEGTGSGWLQTHTNNHRSTTFLEHCLAVLIPSRLSQTPRLQRSAVLQRVWNLGEGLAHEPLWLNQYAILRTKWSVDLMALDTHLAKVLAPVLSPVPPAKWTGKVKLSTLNLRPAAASFVPGRMYLASPAVLCVEDRVAKMHTLGILLQKSGSCEILGPVGQLPEHIESFDHPEVKAGENLIVVNENRLPAPWIHAAAQTLCVQSGYVIVSAEDSQRLWLVEAE